MGIKIEQRLNQHDREIAAIRKLILTGMKMLNHTDQQISALTKAQLATEQKLQNLIEALRGPNGRKK